MNTAVTTQVVASRTWTWPLGLPSIEARQFDALEKLGDVLDERIACRQHLIGCLKQITAGDLDPFRSPQWWHAAVGSGCMVEAAESIGLGRQWVYAVAVRLCSC